MTSRPAHILACLFCAVSLAACSGGAGQGADASGDGRFSGPCTVDSDQDTISDGDEGASAVDTDADGTPDSLDTDADGDTIPDQLEAGDADPCTAPRDADGDGVADFRDLDADANGIPDQAESLADTDGDGIPDAFDVDDDGDRIEDRVEIGPDPSAPLDTDGDGLADFVDLDADGDTIPDAVEGVSDLDDDGAPAYADTDADGDGIADAVEAGPDPGAPRDADGDGLADFLDSDSDNDGLADGQEDLDGDGVLDPGESDPRAVDTDADGFPDLVEWAAGTDPNDPTSVLSADDFFFTLPYRGATAQDELDFRTDVLQADVFFEIDTTGSMSGTIAALQSALLTVIVPGLDASIADLAMGAGWFRDFPVLSFGDPGDLPFFLAQRITSDVAAVQSGLDTFQAGGGGDIPESGIEALYQSVTGEGVVWDAGPGGRVAKFDAYAGYDPAQGHGLIPGVGFRAGALPIIVHATDAPFHQAAEYWLAGLGDAHSRAQAVAAAQALGARFIGIMARGQDKSALAQLARDTGALVPPWAWGAGETLCHTGLGGAPEVAGADGLCPLAFTMDFDGGGVHLHVVDGIRALVNYATLDISSVAVADPAALPLDTARFITSITPVLPAPPGSSIDGDVFRDVLPGQPVRFAVRARNDLVPGAREARLFRVSIRVVGSAVTVLDERDVFVVVPALTYIP